jgi:hypothetical protein
VCAYCKGWGEGLSTTPPPPFPSPCRVCTLRARTHTHTHIHTEIGYSCAGHRPKAAAKDNTPHHTSLHTQLKDKAVCADQQAAACAHHAHLGTFLHRQASAIIPERSTGCVYMCAARHISPYVKTHASAAQQSRSIGGCHILLRPPHTAVPARRLCIFCIASKEALSRASLPQKCCKLMSNCWPASCRAWYAAMLPASAAAAAVAASCTPAVKLFGAPADVSPAVPSPPTDAGAPPATAGTGTRAPWGASTGASHDGRPPPEEAAC